jgi:hypothetical protein
MKRIYLDEKKGGLKGPKSLTKGGTYVCRPGPRGKAGLTRIDDFLPGLHVKHSKTASFIQEGNYTIILQKR